MRKKSLSIAAISMAVCLSLTACAGTKNVEEASVPIENVSESGTESSEISTETIETASEASTETAVAEDASSYASDVANTTIDTSIYLDYSAGIEAGVYKWVLSEDGKYYTLAAVDEEGEPITRELQAINVGANNAESIDNGDEDTDKGDNQAKAGGELGGLMDEANQGEVYQGVYINGNITNLTNQTMLVYVPAEYMEVDEEGNVTGINHDAAVGNYTADTAPIVYANEMGGWRSSEPKKVNTDYIDQGMIYVAAGGRSRDAFAEDGTTHTGKAPTQMADLKSGIIELRANTDIIPGDTDKIVSVGTSGGGQMSSILGASGNMSEYYEYMYEAGTLGVTKNDDGTYTSAYPDNIYAAQLYCPIADFENADLAYAWWWVNLVDDGGVYNGSITDFEKRLQELEADAFIGYLNSLNLTDENGNALTLTGLREGTYYDAILQNISDALNAAVENGDIDPETAYTDYDSWLTKNDDGTWTVTDMDGFMIGTGLVNQRNKAIPGFDALDMSAENDAFGTADEDTVHFSASIAKIMQDNYDELSELDGFDKDVVDSYIEDALTGDNADLIDTQTSLLNATEILLGNDGYSAVDPALYWRDRSGTADQHTSFSIGYNILLAAQMKGLNVDYHLVWDMTHGSNEGTSTGTFIDWINEICQ
ncbi:hypothetical protein QYZ88_005800 [Lachnospiraceae bacterium C1.1]|nr:hypothetical protein [Lachnospiraceae bacterium C1.1]